MLAQHLHWTLTELNTSCIVASRILCDLKSALAVYRGFLYRAVFTSRSYGEWIKYFLKICLPLM